MHVHVYLKEKSTHVHVQVLVTTKPSTEQQYIFSSIKNYIHLMQWLMLIQAVIFNKALKLHLFCDTLLNTCEYI